MEHNDTLVFLSNCGIDAKGMPDAFMLQELPWLQSRFAKLWLVCHEGVADITGFSASAGERLKVSAGLLATVTALFCPWLTRELWDELRHMARGRQLSVTHAIKLVLFAIRGRKLHMWLEKLLKSSDINHTTLYAYWMSYEAYAAALSKRKHENVRLIVRGHAYDIDLQRNPVNPYLMKRFIAREADGLYLISEYAKNQYLHYMADQVSAEKLNVVGIGSAGKPVEGCKAPLLKETGIFHLVSCAAIVEIKQLPLLIDALALWEGPPLRWLHMGGGPQEAKVRAYAQQRLGTSTRVTYEITGSIPNEKVQATYESQAFDAFINTSRLEGVPVSIMEAMRFGIPVIGPRGGGIPELVDDTVGMLYEPEQGVAGVLQALRAFVALPTERVQALRNAAQACWNATCRSQVLLPLLFPPELCAQGGEHLHD